MRSRLNIVLEESIRPSDAPMRLSTIQADKISKSLLFVADGTSVASIAGEKESSLLISPHVCLEIGYATATKANGQILLVKTDRSMDTGKYPLELPPHQQLEYKNISQLRKTLPIAIENLLARYNLFSTKLDRDFR